MSGELRMPSVRFRQEREASWRALEGLVDRVQRSGLRSLSAEELGRLPVLYRAALSSLSVARAIALDAALLAYLNALAARAHVVLYGGREPFAPAFWRFWARTFPAAVRSLGWHTLVAVLLTALGTGVAWRELARDPARFSDFVPPAYAQGRGPEATDADLRQVLQSKETPRSALIHFSSFLFTHNATIGLASLGLGFAAGVPTAYLVLTNGLILGAFGWLYGSRGLGWEFWAWTLPHGVTEIWALLLCAAAGLRMGQALVFPGRVSRLSSLRRAGDTAGVVALGAVAMFLLAGLIEGVFRQSVGQASVRWAVAGSSFALWSLYFSLAGRGR
ncbi:MAG TPA: stage II sporulation protein M [Myxococcaceae bacterium]|nr:stage II sporulation protein M [Myxococcaceae bacterium]